MYEEWVNKLLHMEAHCVEAYDATHFLRWHHPFPPPPPSPQSMGGWVGWVHVTRPLLHMSMPLIHSTQNKNI
jgi:hypothetical protein